MKIIPKEIMFMQIVKDVEVRFWLTRIFVNLIILNPV